MHSNSTQFPVPPHSHQPPKENPQKQIVKQILEKLLSTEN